MSFQNQEDLIVLLFYCTQESNYKVHFVLIKCLQLKLTCYAKNMSYWTTTQDYLPLGDWVRLIG